MMCFLGVWDEGGRQANACSEFSSNQLIFSIQTPLYPHVPTSPIAVLALFMWGDQRCLPMSWHTASVGKSWLAALIERNLTFNWAAPTGPSSWSLCSSASCAPSVGEQVSYAAVMGSLMLICPLGQFPLALIHTGASVVPSVRWVCF